MMRFARFSEQDVKRRNIGIPFNERGHRPEARQRCLVEPPYSVVDTIAVGVDEAIVCNQMPDRKSVV